MTGENVFKDFAGQGEKLQKFVTRYDDKALSKRPAEDKWSGKEIIGHLGDCEQVYGFRFKLALAQPGSPFQAFEQTPWVKKLRHQDRSVGEMVEDFKRLRETNTAILKGIKPEEWERFGIHPEAGMLTISQMVKRLTDHFESHLKQVEKAAG